ncbi:hypothetical protein [Neptuniibacter sp. QD37_11]|uniref:hypothetical protein n=1 Tax=Neptuniibacter sp. QD37_11 TaxID=3398209 RepID=UPI0039F4C277
MSTNTKTTEPNAGDNLLMPRALTAENGGKHLMIGEFQEVVKLECTACDGDDEDCEVCSGHGTFTYRVPVGWDTIKEIYQRAADHFGVDPSALLAELSEQAQPAEPSGEEKLEALKNDAHAKLTDAEQAWHAYACECDIGPARVRAFDTYENIRVASRR